jgi:hypothetical protein
MCLVPISGIIWQVAAHTGWSTVDSCPLLVWDLFHAAYIACCRRFVPYSVPWPFVGRSLPYSGREDSGRGAPLLAVWSDTAPRGGVMLTSFRVQCARGHVLCGDCHVQRRFHTREERDKDTCPTCTIPLEGIRNRALERIRERRTEKRLRQQQAASNEASQAAAGQGVAGSINSNHIEPARSDGNASSVRREPSAQLRPREVEQAVAPADADAAPPGVGPKRRKAEVRAQDRARDGGLLGARALLALGVGGILLSMLAIALVGRMPPYFTSITRLTGHAAAPISGFGTEMLELSPAPPSSEAEQLTASDDTTEGQGRAQSEAGGGGEAAGKKDQAAQPAHRTRSQTPSVTAPQQGSGSTDKPRNDATSGAIEARVADVGGAGTESGAQAPSGGALSGAGQGVYSKDTGRGNSREGGGAAVSREVRELRKRLAAEVRCGPEFDQYRADLLRPWRHWR